MLASGVIIILFHISIIYDIMATAQLYIAFDQVSAKFVKLLTFGQDEREEKS